MRLLFTNDRTLGVSLRQIGVMGLALLAASPAHAGPPYLTDDPEPTDYRHWEIYAPLFEGEGRGGDLDGSSAIELNYGAARNVQVTLGLPFIWARSAGRWHGGRGDLELSVKYRVVNLERAGLQIAVFPGATLPTGSPRFSARRVTALLPVWFQKDVGRWAVFGGGGYAINPGAGNRNYWTAGIAATRTFGSRLQLGVEAKRQGADTRGGKGSTSLGVGGILKLSRRLRLLASGGPTFEDGGRRAGYHGFLALGIDY